MSYSFWRPPTLAPGAIAPSVPLATPLHMPTKLFKIASAFYLFSKIRDELNNS